VAGMIVYNTPGNAEAPAGLYYNNGSAWVRLVLPSEVTAVSGDDGVSATTSGATTTVSLTDLGVTTGKLANASVTADKLHQMGATNGQTLTWDGTAQKWVPGSPTKKIVSVKDAAYTVQADDDVVITEHSASVNITMPVLTAAHDGKVVYIMNNNSGGSGNNFDNDPKWIFGQGTSMTPGRGALFIWDNTGSRWISVSK
ncbi:hypothetical protein, partial [Paludibacter sp. 221]|uniref:hypothetical protein n=1 Tax=Paludibacter sp. 221 TaxID=2302939 RepID=UPI00194373C9